MRQSAAPDAAGARIGVQHIEMEVQVELGPGTTVVHSSPLPADVVSRIEALTADDADKVWIVPTITRDGSTRYDPSDIHALKLAKEANLDAAYLVPSEERTYIAEFSAEWILQVALAVTTNLTVDVATNIGAYLLKRALHAVGMGQHQGSAEAVRVKLSLAQFERTADGAMSLENLQIEGNAAGVAAAITALVSKDDSATARPSLDSDRYIDGSVTSEN
jgi:hypothetical protein